jgi:predicted  nucleic acid-binding Zn-ribbon protein
MFVELPQNLFLMTAGAFLLGWLVSRIIAKIGTKQSALERDPRDFRIQELEAELRIAKSNSDKSLTDVEKLEEELKETTVGLERRDIVITEQQGKIETISKDLKGSVLKTRELRAELTDRGHGRYPRRGKNS